MRNVWLAVSIFFGVLFVSQEVYAANVQEIREVIQSEYVDQLSKEQLSGQTVKDLMKQLDAYSTYMSPEEFQRFLNGIEKRLVGVGIVLEESASGAKIISVLEASPAQLNGLEEGDEITHVDGQNIAGKSVQSIISLISGKEYTTVTLTIKREQFTFQKSVERREIQVPTVEKKMLGGNVGFIRLQSFGTDSAKEMMKAMQFLNGADHWIVDLRNNGGGYVRAAQEVTGLFPQAEQAFQLRYQQGEPEKYKVIKQAQQFEGTTALLVNGYSASASEMVAAAVKELGIPLYGQTTYGKGTMQTFYELSDNAILKLTTARFYSPAGVTIDQQGVKPTIETIEGEELARAHYELLTQKWSTYKQIPSLHKVPTTKEFTIKMNSPMKWTENAGDAIELIELGGAKKPVKAYMKDSKTLIVTPLQPLSAKSSYLLVIHPKWVNERGKTVKQGAYLSVDVQ